MNGFPRESVVVDVFVETRGRESFDVREIGGTPAPELEEYAVRGCGPAR